MALQPLSLDSGFYGEINLSEIPNRVEIESFLFSDGIGELEDRDLSSLGKAVIESCSSVREGTNQQAADVKRLAREKGQEGQNNFGILEVKVDKKDYIIKFVGKKDALKNHLENLIRQFPEIQRDEHLAFPWCLRKIVASDDRTMSVILMPKSPGISLTEFLEGKRSKETIEKACKKVGETLVKVQNKYRRGRRLPGQHFDFLPTNVFIDEGLGDVKVTMIDLESMNATHENLEDFDARPEISDRDRFLSHFSVMSSLVSSFVDFKQVSLSPMVTRYSKNAFFDGYTKAKLSRENGRVWKRHAQYEVFGRPDKIVHFLEYSDGSWEMIGDAVKPHLSTHHTELWHGVGRNMKSRQLASKLFQRPVDVDNGATACGSVFGSIGKSMVLLKLIKGSLSSSMAFASRNPWYLCIDSWMLRLQESDETSDGSLSTESW